MRALLDLSLMHGGQTEGGNGGGGFSLTQVKKCNFSVQT